MSNAIWWEPFGSRKRWCFVISFVYKTEREREDQRTEEDEGKVRHWRNNNPPQGNSMQNFILLWEKPSRSGWWTTGWMDGSGQGGGIVWAQCPSIQFSWHVVVVVHAQLLCYYCVGSSLSRGISLLCDSSAAASLSVPENSWPVAKVTLSLGSAKKYTI